MKLSMLPNLITTLRVLLLFPLVYFLLEDNFSIALVIFFAAGFSDALDGYLAKRFGWVSRFGAIMDPLADKALLVVTMAILTIKQEIDWLLFIIVVIRDIYIVAGATYYYWRVGPYEMSPSRLSKLNTFTQLLLVTSILTSLGYMTLPEEYLQGLVILTYLTTISSGIHYGCVWSKRLKLALKNPARDKLTDKNNPD